MGFIFARILTFAQGKVIFGPKMIYLQILEGFSMVFFTLIGTKTKPFK